MCDNDLCVGIVENTNEEDTQIFICYNLMINVSYL